jgi:uncharacterized protein YbaR (Trm112 family)
MHIELTEMLRCPAQHPEAHLVLAPGEMRGRDVRTGVLGCPVCHAEYAIVEGVGVFGGDRGDRGDGGDRGERVPGADELQALLGLSNAGGHVVLLGQVARVGEALAELLGGTHVVGVNAPANLAGTERLSLVTGRGMIPLRSASARGVVVSGEYAVAEWLREAARVVLKGLRVVVLGNVEAVPGVELMAQSPGAWVGQKTARGVV